MSGRFSGQSQSAPFVIFIIIAAGVAFLQLDGDKRTGFMAAFVFLGINQINVVASESDVVVRTLAVAANEMDKKGYASWLEQNSRMDRRRKRKTR